MTNVCYAMVRGSAIRVTELGRVGQLLDPIRFATSKSIAKVMVNEVSEAGGNELLRSDEDEARLHFVNNAQTIRHTVDIDFLRCDPGALSIVSGVPVVVNAAGVVVGFDSDMRRPAASFALEVWSKLDGQRCTDGTPAWGYTLFPFLRGGYLTGFEFKNGRVSFTLRGAQTRRVSRWGVGPFDLEGPYRRLLAPISRSVSFKQMVTPATPPAQMDGVQETSDIIDGGTAAVTTDDVIDGGTAADAGVWVIDGGRAL